MTCLGKSVLVTGMSQHSLPNFLTLAELHVCVLTSFIKLIKLLQNLVNLNIYLKTLFCLYLIDLFTP